MLRCPGLKGLHAIWAMERSIPQKSHEERRLLLRDLGLIIAAAVPTSFRYRPPRQETHMNGETVLLRVVDGPWEGWRWMPFDEFLQRVSIDAWNEGQALVGMVLPPVRRGTLH
jgi:hypothetical protein